MSKTISIKEKMLEAIEKVRRDKQTLQGTVLVMDNYSHFAAACAAIHEAEVKELREELERVKELIRDAFFEYQPADGETIALWDLFKIKNNL